MAKDASARNTLSKEAREELTRRVLAGEKATTLGSEFGVTRAYVSLLKATALDPDRFKRKREAKLSVKLTQAQFNQLKHTFDTSKPADHGLTPARDFWTLEHGIELAWKLFEKKPSTRAMKECMGEHLLRRPHFGDPKPQPPRIQQIEEMDPELACDPSFVAYVQSPTYRRIAEREYEIALAEWHQRNPNGEKIQSTRESSVSESGKKQLAPPPRQRLGKHANSKGSPFTPPKKRRKKR